MCVCWKKKQQKEMPRRIRQNHKIRWLKLTSIIHKKKNTKWNCKKKKKKCRQKQNKTNLIQRLMCIRKTKQNVSEFVSSHVNYIIECIKNFQLHIHISIRKFILLHSERSSDMVGHKAKKKKKIGKLRRQNTKHLKCYKNKYKKWRFISSFHWILLRPKGNK